MFMQIGTGVSSSVDKQSIHMARQAATLLLVDDNQDLREVLQAVLTLEGYRVITAPDGPTALQVAGRMHFDMLITDFQMPGMDGYALATQLTQRRLMLPVLLISAADPADLPIAELAKHKWEYLRKPLDNARMLQLVDRGCLGWAMQGVGLLGQKASLHLR